MSLCHKSCHCPPITPFIQIPKSVAASHCTTLQHPIHLYTHQSCCVFSALQRGAACCSVVQRGAVWCSVVQCAAACYRLLQCVRQSLEKAFQRSLSAKPFSHFICKHVLCKCMCCSLFECCVSLHVECECMLSECSLPHTSTHRLRMFRCPHRLH